MKKRGIPIEALHCIGCLLLILNSLLCLLPPVVISVAPNVPMAVSFINKLWMLAFPVFSFLLVEEFHHTGNFKRLAACVLIFAVVFEIPFDLIQCWRPFDIYLNNQFFTLFLGLLALKIFTGTWHPVWKLMGLAALGAVSCVTKCEYGLCGLLMVFLFQLTRAMPLKRLLQLLGMLILAWLCPYITLRGIGSMISPGYIPLRNGQYLDAQYFCILSLIPISLCGQSRWRGSKRAVAIAYGAVPIAFVGIYFLRRHILGV